LPEREDWTMTTNQAQIGDIGRQFLNVFGAIFQIYASSVAGSAVGVVAAEIRSPIAPASYTFVIWNPIFLLCALYAISQALPARRADPVYRTIGWWTAGAFLANGAWTYVFTNRLHSLAQIIIFASFVCAGFAYFGFARSLAGAEPAAVDNWIVGPALGLLFGWITAATIVGLASTLVAQGFARDGQGAEVVGAGLLLIGGVAAFLTILASKTGPSSEWIAYAAAALWAFIAVVVAQRTSSLLTTGAAVACALLVVLALFGPWVVPTPSSRSGATVDHGSTIPRGR
jgi:hypothetical protein